MNGISPLTENKNGERKEKKPTKRCLGLNCETQIPNNPENFFCVECKKKLRSSGPNKTPAGKTGRNTHGKPAVLPM